MAMPASESSEVKSSSEKGKSFSFYNEEALGYLVFWCRTHYGWVPKDLGEIQQKIVIETLSRNEWFWHMKWNTQDRFEHPVTRRYAMGKRYCYQVSKKGMNTSSKIHHDAKNLRAWVTCWEDDTISVKIAII